MKLKNTLVFVLLLAAATFSTYYLSLQSSEKPSKYSEKKVLLPETLAQATRVQIEKAGETSATLTIVKNNAGYWTIPDYYSLPVEFEKLRSLMNSLTEAEIIRFVTSDPERIKQNLRIGKSRIRLFGSDDTLLWQLDTGQSSKNGGTYIQLNKEPEALLADRRLLVVDTQHDTWVARDVLGHLKSEDIAEFHISFMEEAEPLVLTRSTPKEPFSSEEIKETQEIQQSEVTRLLNRLIKARYTEVVEASNPDAVAAKSYPIPFKLKRFKGDTYTLNLGRRPPRVAVPDGSDGTENESKRSDPGPVFIFYEFSNPQNPWLSAMENKGLTFPESVYTLIPNTRTELIGTVENPAAESFKAETPASEATGVIKREL